MPNTDYVHNRDKDALVKASAMEAAFTRYHELYNADKNRVMHYKGTVSAVADLANIQNPAIGDVYNVTATAENYAWDGTNWDSFGSLLDLTNYTGNVSINGNISATGTISAGATISSSSDITAAGDISSDGEVIAHSTDLLNNTVTHSLTEKLDEEQYRAGLTWDELRAKYTWEDLAGATATATTTLTEDLGLTKATGPIDISVINNNFDILDAAHQVTVSPGTTSAAATSVNQIKFKDNSIWKLLDEVRLYNGTDALYCKEGVTTGLLMQDNQVKVVNVTWNNGIPAVGNTKGYLDGSGNFNVTGAITATGAITGSSISDGTGTLAQLRESVSRTIVNRKESFTSSSSTAYTGHSITVPANSLYAFHVSLTYLNSNPQSIVISVSNSDISTFTVQARTTDGSGVFICGYADTARTFYIWAKYASAGSNELRIRGWHMPAQ